MGLIFRRFREEDEEKLKGLMINMRNDYVPPLSDGEIAEEVRKIRSGASKALVSLAKTSALAGFLIWEPYSKKKCYGYVANLGVSPEYRRKGVSTKLREIAFGLMKRQGFKGVYYTTWHSNSAMIESSKKLGLKMVRSYLDEKFRGPGGKTMLFRKIFNIKTKTSSGQPNDRQHREV